MQLKTKFTGTTDHFSNAGVRCRQQNKLFRNNGIGFVNSMTYLMLLTGPPLVILLRTHAALKFDSKYITENCRQSRFLSPK